MKKLYTLSLLNAVFICQLSLAAIIYTDVVPDVVTVPSSTAMFDVDIDNNMVPDFRITCVDITGFRFIIAQAGQIGLGNFVLEDTAGGLHNALALAQNAPIGPTQTVWHSMASTNPTLFSDFLGTYSGLWLNSLDYYLGVQFLIGSNTHYGWIRMNIAQSTGIVTLKDYAYDDSPNTPILAGVHAALSADVATNIVVSDVDENSNGSDLNVTFNKAADETTVDTYRVIIVKGPALTFNLTAAQAVPASSYFSIIPSGSNVSTILPASIKDADGDPLTFVNNYKIFVLSKANAAVVSNDSLSMPSNAVLLITHADVTTTITCKDIADNGNSSDMQVSFTKAGKESGVGKYHIIVLKSSVASMFNRINAKNLVASRYMEVMPAGSDIQTTLLPGLLDSDGDPIKNSTAYKVVVHSLPSLNITNIDSLSAPSAQIILGNATGIAGNGKETLNFYITGSAIVINLSKNTAAGFFRLVDLSGRIVVSKQFSGRQLTLQLPELKGAYVGQLFSEGKQFSKAVNLGND